MKILVVAPFDSLHGKRWAERLENLGHDVLGLDITHSSSRQVINNLEIFSIPDSKYDLFPLVSYLGKIFRTRKMIREIEINYRPDVISLNWLYHPISLAVSLFSTRPIIATPWGSDLLIPNLKASDIIRKSGHCFQIRKLISKCSFFTCDAEHMKEALVRFGAKPQLVELIYFGVDVNEFNSSKRSNLFRSKYLTEDRDILILSNRQLAQVYRIDVLLKAISLVEFKIKNRLVLLIASDGPERKSLQNLCNDLGIASFVHFLGRLSDEEMFKSVASADIYVSSSPTDGGIASSVAEAMASSIAVITTDFGDNPKWVSDTGAGLTYSENNELALRDAISKVALDELLRESMGERGRNKILRDNNAITETKKLDAIFKKFAIF